MRVSSLSLLLVSSPIIRALHCYDQLDSILEAERDVVDDSNLRVYELCTDTTFDVAESLEEGNGQKPLIIGRSNIIIKCGEDGKSAGNCVLSGGIVHASLYDEFHTDKPVSTAILRGLTFENARAMNVWIAHDGDILLEDCIFRGNHNSAPVSVDGRLFDTSTGRRSLATVAKENFYMDRDLAHSDSLEIRVTIHDSLFEDNKVWSQNDGTDHGIIDIKGGKVTTEITHTTFMNTGIQDENMANPFIIMASEGSLTLDNNCYIGNHPKISNVLAEGADFDHNSEFVQRISQDAPRIGCLYAATHDFFHSNTSNVECIEDDAEVCTASSIAKVTGSYCFDQLDEIYHTEKELPTSDLLRTYILCPRTIYTVAAFATAESSPNSTMPIILNHPNVRILCGADGKSSNDCILSGGKVQLALYDEHGLTGSNIASSNVVRGLTFTNAVSYNVLAAYTGELDIVDCIFENNTNAGALYIQEADPTSFYKLEDYQMPVSYAFGKASTSVGLTTPFDVNITIRDTAFVYNTISTVDGDSSLTTHSSGLITNHGGNLRIVDTSFLGIRNRLPPPKVAYIISNDNGQLSLANNCFSVYEPEIAPVVGQSGSIVAVSNYGPKKSDASSMCEFISKFHREEDNALNWTDTSFRCIPFDGQDCITDDELSQGLPSASRRLGLLLPGMTAAFVLFTFG